MCYLKAVASTLALIGEPVKQNITIIDFQEHIFSHCGANEVSISNILDDERLCFHPTSIDSTIRESLKSPGCSLKGLTNELEETKFL